MNNLARLITALEAENERLNGELKQVRKAISALMGINRIVVTKGSTRARMSAVARRKIAAAQRARWAKVKANRPGDSGKRQISAAGVASIRAAQRARWAKWRKQQKAA